MTVFNYHPLPSSYWKPSSSSFAAAPQKGVLNIVVGTSTKCELQRSLLLKYYHVFTQTLFF